VVATQGRAFWILDDLPLLYQLNGPALDDAVHLFQPKDAYRVLRGGFQLPPSGAQGQNPTAGAVVYYSFKEKPKDDVTIEFLDSAGKLIRKFSSKAPAEAHARRGESAAEQEAEDPDEPRPSPTAERVPVEAGLNRFVWNLRYPDATTFPGLIMWAGNVRGPAVVPGKYQVRLTAGGKTQTQTFEIKKDHRLATTPEDYAKQLELATQIQKKLSDSNAAVIEIREIRRQLNEYAERVKNSKIVDAAKALAKSLTAIEEALYQTKNRASEDPLNFPIKLNNKLAALEGVVESSDDPPPAQTNMVYEDLASQVNAQLNALKKLASIDLTAFNKLVRDENVPAIAVAVQ